jgi:peptide/nickel transport system permease protein
MTTSGTAPLSRREWLLSERPASRMQARLGRIYVTWRRFSANRLAMVGLGIILLLLVVAALADVLATHSPYVGDLKNARLVPPGSEYWFGTDDLGRDIYSRIIYGSRLTLFVVVLVAIIAAPIGLLVGTVAGYAGWRSPSWRRWGPASRTPCWQSPSPPGRPMRALRGPRRSRCAIPTSSRRSS